MCLCVCMHAQQCTCVCVSAYTYSVHCVYVIINTIINNGINQHCLIAGGKLKGGKHNKQSAKVSSQGAKVRASISTK